MIRSKVTPFLPAAIACLYKRRYGCVLGIFFFVIASSAIGFAQPESRSGIKLGLEVGKFLSTQSGSFQKVPGFTAGFFTPIDLLADSNSSLSLSLEFNFTRMIHYRLGHEVFYENEDGRYRSVLDETFVVSFVEAGLLPTFFYSLDERMTFGLHVGLSVGIGKEHLTFHEQSRIVIDTLYHFSTDGIYGEYGKGLRTPASLNIGVNWWYGSLMFEARYKYTYISRESEVKNVRNFYIQVGLAF